MYLAKVPGQGIHGLVEASSCQPTKIGNMYHNSKR